MATPTMTAEAILLNDMVQVHEAAAAAEKAAKAEKEALAEAIRAFADKHSLWVEGKDGLERVSLPDFTVTKKVTVSEKLMDAFRAYRVEKLITLKVLQDAIKFDASRLKLAVKKGLLTEEQRQALITGTSTSESIVVSRPSR